MMGMQGDVDMKSYPITDSMKKLPVDELFDEMAGKLVDFAAGEFAVRRLCQPGA